MMQILDTISEEAEPKETTQPETEQEIMRRQVDLIIAKESKKTPPTDKTTNTQIPTTKHAQKMRHAKKIQIPIRTTIRKSTRSLHQTN